MKNEKDNSIVRQPRQARGIETKQKILQAGMELFSVQGYHNTNSKEIVKKAGTGIGTFYGYFKDKKDVFLQILERYKDSFVDQLKIENLEQIISNKQYKELVHNFVWLVFKLHEDAPTFHNEAVQLRYKDPEIGSVLNEWDEANRHLIIYLLTAVREHSQIDDPEAASYIILRTIEENIHYLYLAKQSKSSEDLMRQLSSMIYKYIFC